VIEGELGSIRARSFARDRHRRRVTKEAPAMWDRGLPVCRGSDWIPTPKPSQECLTQRWIPPSRQRPNGRQGAFRPDGSTRRTYRFQRPKSKAAKRRRLKV